MFSDRGTFAGRVHVEWDTTAPITPIGHLSFFIDYLKQAGLFDAWVADCPLSFTSPTPQAARPARQGDAVCAGWPSPLRAHHGVALRPGNPPLLGMHTVLSEDSVRRGFAKIDAAKGLPWLQNHLDACTTPLLSKPWVLDMDSTVKTLYGHQEGAAVGYNPHKPGRPSHVYHTRLCEATFDHALSSLCLALELPLTGVHGAADHLLGVVTPSGAKLHHVSFMVSQGRSDHEP